VSGGILLIACILLVLFINKTLLENALHCKPTGTKSKKTSGGCLVNLRLSDKYYHLFCPKISESREMSTAVRWVPSTYSSDVSQYVLVRPPRAPCGNRQLFGFPITRKDLCHLGTIAFNRIQPGETLPDNKAFLVANSLAFIELSLHLHVCTMASGKVVGDSKNIPSECVWLGEVLLLVLWRDTEPEATCPTPSQVQSLEDKLKRLPGWWVEAPVRVHLHSERCSTDIFEFLAILMNVPPSFHDWLCHLSYLY
jgi:hypothetical protein